MNYVWWGIAAYLAVGMVLTLKVLRIPRRRMRLRDLALGAVVMPVLSTALFLCVLFEDLWRRLIIVLDLDPPEEMRAGPKDPSDSEK